MKGRSHVIVANILQQSQIIMENFTFFDCDHTVCSLEKCKLSSFSP